MVRKQREIVREIVKKCELPQYEVKKVLEAFRETIWDFMANGDNVLFGNIGRFEVKIMRAHGGRNPMTGEPLNVPVTRKASFKVGTSLRRAVKANRRGFDNG